MNSLDSRPRLLDLFCGAGGASRGYQLAGFHVTGVDLHPQPSYCGDVFIQGDAIEYIAKHGHEYAAIHSSPPCQKFTSLKSMSNAREHDDLLTPTREALIATGKPYVIENVPGAPMPARSLVLCGTAFGLGVEVYDGWRELRRHRWFESNQLLLGPGCAHRGATIGIYGDHARDRRRKPGVRERGVDFPDCDRIDLAQKALGIDWMNWHELSQAIPPAYTRHIGEQIMAAIERDTPLTPAPPRRPTVRKLFAPTRSYPSGPLLLAESRRQYPDAVAIYAHRTTVDAFDLTGVQADDRVPKGLIEIEVEEGTR